MKIKFSAIVIMLCLMFIAVQAGAGEVRWGINSPEGAHWTMNRWGEFAEYLSKESGQDVKFIPIPISDFFQTVQKEPFDFYLSTSGQAVFLEKKLGVTVISNLNDSETGSRYGGVIIAKKGSGITKSSDLKGKKVISLGKASSGAYLFQVYHLHQQGIDPQKDFAKFFTGGKKLNDLVLAVKSEVFDAAFIRTGTLEEMAKEGAIRMDEFVIVDQRTDPDFPFVHTTILYPSWSLSASKKTDASLIGRFKEIVLNLPGDLKAAGTAKIKGFSAPLPLDDFHEAMKASKVPPYDE